MSLVKSVSDDFQLPLPPGLQAQFPASSSTAQSVSSVAQSYPTLCDPMDCSTPGFPVHHQLPEPTQTHGLSQLLKNFKAPILIIKSSFYIKDSWKLSSVHSQNPEDDDGRVIDVTSTDESIRERTTSLVLSFWGLYILRGVGWSCRNREEANN